MKSHNLTKTGIFTTVIVGATLLMNGSDLAANFNKGITTVKEVGCVGVGALSGIVTIDALDCSATGGTVTTPATPTGPSESTGN